MKTCHWTSLALIGLIVVLTTGCEKPDVVPDNQNGKAGINSTTPQPVDNNQANRNIVTPDLRVTNSGEITRATSNTSSSATGMKNTNNNSVATTKTLPRVRNQNKTTGNSTTLSRSSGSNVSGSSTRNSFNTNNVFRDSNTNKELNSNTMP